MKKEITIQVPTDWSAVTLKKYLELEKDIKNYKEEDEIALTAVLFQHLLDIDPLTLSKLDKETITEIMGDLNQFLNQTSYPLQRTIEVEGIKYGIEPNLSKMPYGAYLDISKYDNLSIDDNWTDIISILYRPITEESGALYEIKPYTGTNKEMREKWLDVNMAFHFGVYFFFIRLLMDLSQDTLNSLKEEGLPPNINLILEKSGEDMRQWLHSHKTTYYSSVKSSKNHSKNVSYTLRI